MAIAFTVPNQKRNMMASPGGPLFVFGTFVLTGNYPAGGESPAGINPRMTNKNALWIDMAGTSGWSYLFDQVNYKIRIFGGAAAQNPGAELTAGAYPASITGDVIAFMAVYPKE